MSANKGNNANEGYSSRPSRDNKNPFHSSRNVNDTEPNQTPPSVSSRAAVASSSGSSGTHAGPIPQKIVPAVPLLYAGSQSRTMPRKPQVTNISAGPEIKHEVEEFETSQAPTFIAESSSKPVVNLPKTTKPLPTRNAPSTSAHVTQQHQAGQNHSIPTVAGPSRAWAPYSDSVDKAMADIKAKLDLVKLSNSSSSVNRNTPRATSSVSTRVGASSDSNNARAPRKRTQWLPIDLGTNNTRGKGKGKAMPTRKRTEFADLPPELRTIIWRLAMDVPRIIELEYGPPKRNGEDLTLSGHHIKRVAPLSCRVPALMHACFESREQALQVYEKRIFATKTQNGPQQEVYFNPRADILYFGDNTCLSTLVTTFNSSPQMVIPRVAINLTGRVTQCCQRDNDMWGVDGGISPMQALHGLDASVTNGGRFLGCKGLKDVFWITQSHLWELQPGLIDPALTSLRPATTDGLTRGQKNLKARLLCDISKVENDVGLEGVGPNLWLDGDKPNFHLVSFAPHSKTDDMHGPSLVYDAMELTQPQSVFLGKDRFKLVNKVRRRTNCYVFMPHKTFPGEGREIGFSGTRAAVTKAKQEIRKLLDSQE